MISTFGVMFTPDQAKSAFEIARVCRPGGKIAMANWAPGGFIGRVFKTLGKHIPPAPGVSSPALWGTEGRIQEFFAGKAKTISLTPRNFVFRYRSPDHFLDVFRTYYGPIHKAVLALDRPGQGALEADLRALLNDVNTADDGSLIAPSDYVDVVICKA